MTMFARILRPASFVVSLAIHIMLFLNVTSIQVSAQNPNKDRIVTKVSFKKTVPPPHKKTEVVKEKVKPELKKKPVKVAKKNKPKPAPTVVAKKPPPVVPAVVAVAKKPPPVDLGKVRRERDEYLSLILSHIEKEKFYPRSARRRGIQAAVDVRFTILSDGKVENISIGKSHAILERAAKEALIKASPLPAPPKSIQGRMNVEYKMAFALN